MQNEQTVQAQQERTEHKHAEFLRAIADGESFDNFEIHMSNWQETEWTEFGAYYLSSTSWLACPGDWKIRRKQQFIEVNGFKVPEPLTVAPEGDFFMADITIRDLYGRYTWNNDEVDKLWLSRGILHSTKENAIAHAKAMLCIDPEAK